MRQKAVFKIAILLVFVGLSLMVSSIQTKNVEAFSNQVIQGELLEKMSLNCKLV